MDPQPHPTPESSPTGADDLSRLLVEPLGDLTPDDAASLRELQDALDTAREHLVAFDRRLGEDDPRAPEAIALRTRIDELLDPHREDLERIYARVQWDRPERAAATTGGTGRMLVADDDVAIRELVRAVLERVGYEVDVADDGYAALALLDKGSYDLILTDVNMPGMDGFELLTELRRREDTRWTPVLFVTTRKRTADVVRALALGADDYVMKPFAVAELLARVQAKLARPPAAPDLLTVDASTGLSSVSALRKELMREVERASRGGAPGTVARIHLAEMPSIRLRLGPRTVDKVLREVGAVLRTIARPLDVAARLDDDGVAVLLPDTDEDSARRRLLAIGKRLAAHPFDAGREQIRVTPSMGYELYPEVRVPSELLAHAHTAAEYAGDHLDLVPQRWQPEMEAEVAARRASRETHRQASRGYRALERLRVPFQIAVTVLIGFALPLILYWRLDVAGLDITRVTYLVVVAGLVTTSLLIWAEGLLALRREDPPDEPATPYPASSAIIAAYLPNESATIVETIESFLRVDYPNQLQIILAYNTPHDLPIERTLRELADRHPSFLPLRVEGSTSKAQNVNAALAHVTGEFLGMYDADHQPDPDNFTRAWRWLSHGADVVQGHCLVRNGDASFVAQIVAVEFEAIYGVSHPGRARLHGFGIFGGSNGFWRTSMLHAIRMRGQMLTEDIDSSLRVLEEGGRVVSDPYLVSRELATTTMSQVWNQRMRWAQGWFQVSMKHLWRGLRSRNLTVRNKFGLLHLLLWREVYPWLSLQVFPLVAYWLLRGDTLDWVVPIFVLTTAFTLSVGPSQTYFAYRVADPEIKRNRTWFLKYLLFSSVFYTEYKNLIGRVAQVKEAMRERAWKVTPRSDPPRPPTDPAVGRPL